MMKTPEKENKQDSSDIGNDECKRKHSELMTFRFNSREPLGITASFESSDSSVQYRHWRVTQIKPGMQGDKLGVKVGYFIRRIDGNIVSIHDDLRVILNEVRINGEMCAIAMSIEAEEDESEEDGDEEEGDEKDGDEGRDEKDEDEKAKTETASPEKEKSTERKQNVKPPSPVKRQKSPERKQNVKPSPPVKRRKSPERKQNVKPSSPVKRRKSPERKQDVKPSSSVKRRKSPRTERETASGVRGTRKKSTPRAVQSRKRKQENIIDSTDTPANGVKLEVSEKDSNGADSSEDPELPPGAEKQEALRNWSDLSRTKEVGSRVIAEFHNGLYYWGHIGQIFQSKTTKKKKYKILFEDGDVLENVKEEKIFTEWQFKETFKKDPPPPPEEKRSRRRGADSNDERSSDTGRRVTRQSTR